MANEMRCPHCNRLEVFEATEPMLITPSIENWKADRIESRIPANLVFECLGCAGWVTIDVRNNLVRKKQRPEPIWDDWAAEVVQLAKDVQRRGDEIPNHVIEGLQVRNYHSINARCTWAQLLVKVMEQKP